MGAEGVEGGGSVYETRRMAVADKILANPEGFDMKTWAIRNSCGTVACLAGTAVLQAEEQGLCAVRWEGLGIGHIFERPSYMRRDLASYARDYLGLLNEGLFYNTSLTAEQAAKALLDAPYL